MSSLRIRAPRPNTLPYRRQSTSAPATQVLHRTTPPLPKPPTPRRSRFILLWPSLGLILGLGAGSFAMHFFVPPTLPAAGSREDALLLEDLSKRIDSEFTVKVLRGKCLGVAKALKGQQTGWTEIIPDAQSAPGNGGSLMGSLQGAKNLGVERIFYNRSDQSLVAIVYFGGSLSGWPGIVHGGLLATSVSEKIALANALASDSTTNSTNAATPQRLPGTGNHSTTTLPEQISSEPSQISIDYKKPTYANKFHVIRVSPASALPNEDVRIPIMEHEWIASLETLSTDSKVCVKATARFETRGHIESAQERVLEGARWSYQELKEWLWPSRQRESLRG